MPVAARALLIPERLCARADGTSTPLIMRSECGGAHRDWAWSRDGQSLVCVDFDRQSGQLRREAAEIHTDERKVCIIDIDNGPFGNIQHYENYEQDVTVSLSAYGEFAAMYVSGKANDSNPRVWIYSPNGHLRTLKVLSVSGRPHAHEFAMPVWHPEQAMLAFNTNRTIYVYNFSRNGSKEVGWLGYFSRNSAGPLGQDLQVECWSPCGLWLAYSHHKHTSPDSTAITVAIVRADGTGPVRDVSMREFVQSYDGCILSCASHGLLCTWGGQIMSIDSEGWDPSTRSRYSRHGPFENVAFASGKSMMVVSRTKPVLCGACGDAGDSSNNSGSDADNSTPPTSTQLMTNAVLDCESVSVDLEDAHSGESAHLGTFLAASKDSGLRRPLNTVNFSPLGDRFLVRSYMESWGKDGVKACAQLFTY